MVNRKHRFLKFLLVMVIAIQPVTFAYAMTAMGGHHGVNHVMTGSAQLDQAVMSADHHDQTMTADRHEVDDQSATSDCCSTPACGAAMVASSLAPLGAIYVDRYFSFHVLWKGVTLLSEKKPPRSLLG